MSEFDNELVVRARAGKPAAWCEFKKQRFDCLVGRHGVIEAEAKREGDACTPIGLWRVVRGYYRPDRVTKPAGILPWLEIEKQMGWCDAPGDPMYNQLCTTSHAASYEVMWRDDEAYDYVLVLDYNLLPALAPDGKGRGSAIFLHVWRNGATHTAGCVALKKQDLQRVLETVGWVRVVLD